MKTLRRRLCDRDRLRTRIMTSHISALMTARCLSQGTGADTIDLHCVFRSWMRQTRAGSTTAGEMIAHGEWDRESCYTVATLTPSYKHKQLMTTGNISWILDIKLNAFHQLWQLFRDVFWQLQSVTWRYHHKKCHLAAVFTADDFTHFYNGRQ
jgi:hypothetical protein